jgi:general secretion pathway protein K
MKTVANERGMVLLMVLLVITLLSVLLSEFAFSTLVDLRLAETFRDSTRGYYLAKGGITVGQTFLRMDTNEYDAPNDPAELWGQGLPSYPVGDGFISITVEDLGGKLNLNLLTDTNDATVTIGRFEELCNELGLVNGSELTDALIDWLDNDAEQYGAESAYYLGLEHPYPAKNGPIETLAELALVKGFDSETIQLLAPHVALFGGVKINVNTASREVLLADMIYQEAQDPVAAVEGILAQRDQGAIREEPPDNKQLSNLATQYIFATTSLDVKSTAFRIVSDAEVNDGRRTFSAVVDHNGKLLQQKVD